MSPTHYVCVVIWRNNPANGNLEFLVIDYRSTDPKTRIRTLKQVKFPGGTNRECPDESVPFTRDREVWEETSLSFLTSKQIWQEEKNAEHVKFGYLVSYLDCWGELRPRSLIDDGDELSAPYWVSASTLGRALFPTHQSVYLAACRELGIL